MLDIYDGFLGPSGDTGGNLGGGHHIHDGHNHGGPKGPAHNHGQDTNSPNNSTDANSEGFFTIGALELELEDGTCACGCASEHTINEMFGPIIFSNMGNVDGNGNVVSATATGTTTANDGEIAGDTSTTARIEVNGSVSSLSLIHISEPTRQAESRMPSSA